MILQASSDNPPDVSETTWPLRLDHALMTAPQRLDLPMESPVGPPIAQVADDRIVCERGDVIHWLPFARRLDERWDFSIHPDEFKARGSMFPPEEGEDSTWIAGDRAWARLVAELRGPAPALERPASVGPPITSWADAAEVLGVDVKTVARRRNRCDPKRVGWFESGEALRAWWLGLEEREKQAATPAPGKARRPSRKAASEELYDTSVEHKRLKPKA